MEREGRLWTDEVNFAPNIFRRFHKMDGGVGRHKNYQVKRINNNLKKKNRYVRGKLFTAEVFAALLPSQENSAFLSRGLQAWACDLPCPLK